MKMVTVKLTPKQANLIWLNADGWLDAGACADGLRQNERAALNSLCNQILSQTHRSKKPEAAFRTDLRERILEEIEAAGFAWHSDDERKILDAIEVALFEKDPGDV